MTTHRDHARLAGRFAEDWGNATFQSPTPRSQVVRGVACHDDAWEERDTLAEITREGLPSAFSRELVGTYDSFEEIDLEDYLGVRGRATEVVAKVDPYAAVLVSLHTHDLLTNQTDRTGMSPAQLETLDRFVEAQSARRRELVDACSAHPELGSWCREDTFRRGFELLQACDSLSLLLCTDFPRAMPLRHLHPDRSGRRLEIRYEPLGGDRARVTPWPFAQERLVVEIPCVPVRGHAFGSHEELRSAIAAAPRQSRRVELVP